MASGILGLGSGQSSTLNSDLIDKLKAAERKSTVAPIETKITNLTTEKEFYTKVETKINELLETVKPFDLFTTATNAFEQKTATTSGDSVVFDAADVTALKNGYTTVNVSQIAQKDVFQSNSFNGTTKSAVINQGTLTINGKNFDTTTLTYQQLADRINNTSGMTATVEQVGSDSYRLVVKSEDTGLDNKLTISGTASAKLGLATKDTYQSNGVTAAVKDAVINQGILTINSKSFDTTSMTYQQLATAITAETGMDASVVQDGTTDSYRLVINAEDMKSSLTISGAAASALGLNISANHTYNASQVLEAQNMTATVDGIAYNLSTNVISIDGLKITASKLGQSSINIVQDTTQIETNVNNFITKYNEFVSLIDTELYNADSKIENKSALRDILSQVKNKLFSKYGDSSDKSIFNYGFELDKSGTLSLNSDTFNTAVENNFSNLQNLFLGKAEKKGLGTTLKELIDGMSYTGGSLNTFDKDISNRETKLNDSKTKAEDALTAKYEQLALQFSAYTTLITQMESSFSGLKMMIEQSIASN